MKISQKTRQIIDYATQKCQKQFDEIDEIAYFNQEKVLNSFQKNAVQARHFNGTTGYGYDDIGRDTLGKVFADTFNAESAIVSPNILSGTHALTLVLFGILRPNDTLLSICGDLYDTLNDVICGKNKGSLRDFGINYDKIELDNNDFNAPKILDYIEKNPSTKLVFIQRSRGYSARDAISIEKIEIIISVLKKAYPNIIIAVDNCYGEFVEKIEPTDVGADIICGSLIKNPGGGIAQTGAYIAGKADLIEQIGYRMTSPSIGTEVGSYQSGYLSFYQGFFMAPHVVANAKKSSVLFGRVFSDLGYDTIPAPEDVCYDIIRSIRFNSADELIAFIRGIQAASPVDSNVVPYPWAMPGYEHQVIMAAGAFVQGSSIELSADSPIKEPYIAYLQGGLTFEHAKLAACYAVELTQTKPKG